MPEVPENCLSNPEVEALVFELARRVESLWASAADHVADAMRAVGVRPVIIHAYVRTSLLVSESSRDMDKSDELVAWDQAVRQYLGTVREQEGYPRGPAESDRIGT